MAFFGNHRAKRWVLVPIVALLAGLALVSSPRYLLYADLPGKSDIIVLFVGSDRDQGSRLKEARQLLQEGYAGYLFIPGSFSLGKAGSGRGEITYIPFSAVKPGLDLPGSRPEQVLATSYFRSNRTAYGFPGVYEATHVEMLLAKKAMDACGFRKAIFVSSPYHMRRIRMISERAIGGQDLSILYVPTRYERVPAGLRSMGWADWVFIGSEFIKICWFRLYALFF